MKLFLSALLLALAFKGIFYILFPGAVQHCAQKLMECPAAHLIGFGWILTLASLAAWIWFVRWLPA